MEVESFGFRLSKYFDGFGVSVVFAEGEDELFVLVREGVEFVEFHTAMFYGRRNGRDCPERRRPVFKVDSKVRIVPDGAMLTFETFSAFRAAVGQDAGECL